MGRLEQRANQALRQRAWDEAVALYSQLVQQHPDRIDYQTRYWWARMQASQSHLLRARQYEEAGDWEQALVELEVAADLDPTNADIQAALKRVRSRLQQPPPPPPQPQPLRFDPLPSEILQQPIEIMTFTDTPLPIVFQSLAEATDLQVILDPDLPETPITVTFSHISLGQAFEQLAQAHKLFFRFLKERTLIVAPDTPEKRRQYEDYWAYTFRIEYTSSASVVSVLRTALRLQFLGHDQKRGTITIVGPRDQVEAAARIIAQMDVAPAEVLIHVDIMEVSRQLLQQYALQVARIEAPAQGVEVGLQPDAEIRLDPGPILSRSNFVLMNLPGLVARLLKLSGHTRLLNSVPIRVVEGVKARVQFGTEVPVPQTTFSPIAAGGVSIQPITSFQYRVIGLNIEITPYVHENGDITLEVVVESSSLAGTGFGGLPIFATSRIEKTIRLRPDETSLIAGLVRQQVQETVTGIPGLDDVPILGALLSRHELSRRESEVIALLTPFVLRPRRPISPQAIAVPPPAPGVRVPLAPVPRPPRPRPPTPPS